MPELPEVQTVVDGLRETILHRSIEGIRFHRRDIREPIPTKKFISFFEKQVIQDIFRRGKYIIFQTSKGYGLFHLGMTGVLAVESNDVEVPLHTHFQAKIAQTNSKIRFTDPRRFGRIGAFETLEQCSWLTSLGVEPLDHPNLSGYLAEIGKNRKVPIKNFIMDSKIMVGVGNIYASESLFLAEVSPLRLTHTLSGKEWRKLTEAIQQILRKAISAGGTTIKDFRTSGGEIGYFANHLLVYGKNDGCPKCLRPIQHLKQAGRSSWYCEFCQS
jgi:formamidopyrimidine-DNA glycosylase